MALQLRVRALVDLQVLPVGREDGSQFLQTPSEAINAPPDGAPLLFLVGIAAAGAMLRAQDPIRSRHGRLTLSYAAASKALQTAVAVAAPAGGGGGP